MPFYFITIFLNSLSSKLCLHAPKKQKKKHYTVILTRLITRALKQKTKLKSKGKSDGCSSRKQYQFSHASSTKCKIYIHIRVVPIFLKWNIRLSMKSVHTVHWTTNFFISINLLFIYFAGRHFVGTERTYQWYVAFACIENGFV